MVGISELHAQRAPRGARSRIGEERHMRLSDKVVLVTGGAGGIGAACADRLVREGAIVFASDVQAAPENPVAGCTYLAHDVSDLGAWQRIVADIVARHG